MDHSIIYQLAELVLGALIIWVGIYLVSRNPFSTLYWITSLFLIGMGYAVLSDPILLNSPNVASYIKWQKILDWTLFFTPVLFMHSSVILSNKKNKIDKILIIAGYIIALLIYIIDVRGGLVLKESFVRYENYRRMDGFEPGVLLIPTVLFTIFYMGYGAKKFFEMIKNGVGKYFPLFFSGLLFFITGLLVMISYYKVIPIDMIFTVGVIGACILFIYPIIKYHLFSEAEGLVFGRVFYYKTIAIVFLVLIYQVILMSFGRKLGFDALVISNFLIMAVLITHPLYEWFGTFINDIVFNLRSGLSVVSDNEVYAAIKNYNEPEKIDNSSLLRLKIISKKVKDGVLPIDALREIISDAVGYFKPKEDEHRRIKNYLKYHLLKMIAFDDAEEGQILWELGFEEYPVRIMSQEGESRSPLFKVSSPSDYSYTSRNAYLALKKEAIHDVTWRISYLEKMSNRRAR